MPIHPGRQTTAMFTSRSMLRAVGVLGLIAPLIGAAAPGMLRAQGVAPGDLASTTGKLESFDVPSREYGRPRRVWVYTPAGYDSQKAGGYPLLVAFDGDEYVMRDAIPVPTILDSLHEAGSAPAFVAVLIPDSTGSARIAELGNSARFVRFVANEVPWVRQHCDVETRAVMGGAGPVMIEANRRLRDVLQAKGYEVAYTEVPGADDAPRYWRSRLPVDLASLAKRLGANSW